MMHASIVMIVLEDESIDFNEPPRVIERVRIALKQQGVDTRFVVATTRQIVDDHGVNAIRIYNTWRRGGAVSGNDIRMDVEED